MSDLVSVVVPVYNVECFLVKCLDSILEQTYKNIEILLIDDGSTDNSFEICDNYSRMDNRVKVFHKPNGGLSDARNFGISKAKGEYITFIDSDDFIENDMVQYLHDMILKHNSDVSICQHKLVDEYGECVKEKVYRFKEKTFCSNEEVVKGYFQCKFIQSVAWGKLYKTKLFETIRYPVGKYHEDEFTTYKILSLCDRIVVGRECKYFYRERIGSITKSFFNIKHMDVVFAAEEREQFVVKNYPKLTFYARGAIVHAANQCLLKIAKTEFDYNNIENINIVKKIQTIYRHYLKDFLKCANSCRAKIIAMIGFLNVKAAIWILRRTNK